MKKTVMNLFYNSLYQVLILFIPLITIPYVSRVIGTNGVGVNALVTSVANFFGTIIMMGMYQLGAREIAKSDGNELRKTFFSLWRIQLFAGILVIVVYFIGVFILVENKQLYFFLEVPFLLSYMFDISWFFTGIGEVKRVILRNTFVKLSSLFLIFMFVKAKSDLWVYVFILSGTNFISNLFFLFSLKTFLPISAMSKDIGEKYYLRQAFSLLLPQVALQLYTNFDDVIVGAIAGNSQLAFYDQSQKIARIIVTILTSMSTIIMPKLATVKNQYSFKKLFSISLNYTLVISLFLCSLVMVNSSNFVYWYYGKNFEEMINNMFWVSLIIIFISYGGVFSNQYMLAKGQYQKFSIPYYIGGILNIFLNLFLVKNFKADGGTLSLIITELFICISRLFLTKAEINLKFIFNSQIKYILIFCITLAVGIIFPVHLDSYLISIIIQSIFCGSIFIMGLFVFKTDVSKNLKNVLKVFLRK